MKQNAIHKKILFIFLIIVMFISSSSTTISAAKPDKVVPTSPSDFKATSISSSSITLVWSASTDNIGVKSYDIYINNIFMETTTTTTYVVNNLTYSTSYQVYVVAKDAAGNMSKPSDILTVLTLKTTAEQLLTEPTTETATTVATAEATATSAVTTSPKTQPASTLPKTKVVGYYAAWAAYSGFTPDKVDVAKLTHINYAFANIGSDLKIAMGYPDVDPSNFNKLKSLKQANPSLKTIISVGGWSWSGRFSDAALTDASRTVFADSCVDFIIKNGFDGVDIDWEYPVSGGLTTNTRRPEDKHNFTLLLQKLREKLNSRGVIDHKSYLLTMAGASGQWYVNNTELGILQQYLDFANIMTYDIHGTWDSFTDFNAPLYANSDSTSQDKWSVDQSVSAWTNAGFPANKLILGVPFYGYIYKEVQNVNNGLYQRYSGGQSISYENIASNYLNKPGFTRYFQPTSMVPWLFNGSTFITYEDPQSIAAKAQYIKTKALGGAVIWELSQDPNRVLLNALYKGLQ